MLEELRPLADRFADGGWRITIDLTEGQVPAILPRDTVAIALLRTEQTDGGKF